MYQLKAYPQYWGPKPYYTTVNLPVIDNLSTEEIEFNTGQIAAILHDMTTSVIAQYKAKSTVASYALPTLESETAYVNENKGFMTTAKNRTDLLEAINVPSLVAGIFPGRATVAKQAGPNGIIPEPYGKQNIAYDPSKLKALVKTLPASDKSFTVGYDTGAPDDQLLAEDIGAELQADGLSTKVVGYQTSDIYGWIGATSSTQGPSTPNVLIDYFWPDSYNTYMWTHISFDATGGLQYMNCDSVPNEAALDSQAVATGSLTQYDKVIENAVHTGCWLNIADKEDAMVAQTVAQGRPPGAHRDRPRDALPVRAAPGLSSRPDRADTRTDGRIEAQRRRSVHHRDLPSREERRACKRSSKSTRSTPSCRRAWRRRVSSTSSRRSSTSPDGPSPNASRSSTCPI